MLQKTFLMPLWPHTAKLCQHWGKGSWALYFCIAARGGRCSLTVEEIVSETGCTTPTVISAIKKLKKQGILLTSKTGLRGRPRVLCLRTLAEWIYWAEKHKIYKTVINKVSKDKTRPIAILTQILKFLGWCEKIAISGKTELIDGISANLKNSSLDFWSAISSSNFESALNENFDFGYYYSKKNSNIYNLIQIRERKKKEQKKERTFLRRKSRKKEDKKKARNMTIAQKVIENVTPIFAEKVLRVIGSFCVSGPISKSRRNAAITLEREKKSARRKKPELVAFNCLCAEFANYWNSLPGMPEIAGMSIKRKNALKRRMKKKLFKSNWKRVLKIISRSPFMKENKWNWKADIDWLLKNDENFLKVLEGKYGGTEGFAPDETEVEATEMTPEAMERASKGDFVIDDDGEIKFDYEERVPFF